ncbi:hypothetical protein HZR84_12045 [Hyphobacterium sp. CCMP332]|nr:hypothetical protein HZR84_12045 [Hyphobacterium sp. CCMP332]
MPIKKLNYYTNQGTIFIKVDIKNVPSWNYQYTEDQEHTNSRAINRKKEHTIGKPHELIRPHHNWVFTLDNTTNDEINNVEIKIEWFQIIDGQEEKIEEWEKKDISIEADDGDIIEDRILLKPRS